VSEVLFNKKARGGPVYNEADTAGRQLTDQLDHLRKAMQPGILSNMERTVKAALGEKSASGMEYTLTNEGMAWLGVRTATLNLGQSLVYKAYGFNDTQKKSSAILSKVAGSRQNISERQLSSAFDSMISARNTAYTDIIKQVNGARRLGMSNPKIIRSLRGGGIGKKEIPFIIRGRVPRWEMSKSFVKSALDRAIASSTSIKEAREARRTIAKRKRQIILLSRKQN